MSSHHITSHLKTIFNSNFLLYSACSLFSFPYHLFYSSSHSSLSSFFLFIQITLLRCSSHLKKISSYLFPLFSNLPHLFIFFFQVLSLSSFGCLCRPMRMSGNKLLGLWEMLQVKEDLFLCKQFYLSIAVSVFYLLYTDSDKRRLCFDK